MQQAAELLGAADKYQLEQLKSLCEEKLCHTTNLENVVSHLIVGDLYQVKSRPSFLVDPLPRVGPLEFSRGSVF